ncbi:MAG: winged helix-turn-helix domain-containing protein [Methylocystis sp.]
MVRKLLIATSSRLFANLAQQFEALGGRELRALAEENASVILEGHKWADTAILDGAFCDAPAWARRLREAGFAGAIVVIGADAPEADAILARPFRFGDLLAALEAAPKTQPLGERGARLTEKEAAILDRLMRAGGASITKAELLADVWGYGPNVSTRTLETHIHRLRRKIEADPSRPKKVLTEDGGYRIASAQEKRRPFRNQSPQKKRHNAL